MADGDIGVHFPDTDPRWKGARSLQLLQTVAERLRARGWQTVNVDATVIAEAPKIAPHAVAMRTGLAGALGTALERVSVKGKTVEQMGALGRREGIAALAVATLTHTGAA